MAKAAAAASESQHVALYTPLHYVPVPPSLSLCVCLCPLLCFSLSPIRCLLLLSGVFFSGCSKLERGPGFSALSESSVSDDTASSCTGLSEEGMEWWWWGVVSVLPLLAYIEAGWGKKGKVGFLQHNIQVKKWDDAFLIWCNMQGN